MIAGSVNGYHYSVGADGTGIKILCSSAVRKTQQRSPALLEKKKR